MRETMHYSSQTQGHAHTHTHGSISIMTQKLKQIHMHTLGNNLQPVITVLMS